MPTPSEAYVNTVQRQGESGARLRPANFGAAGETMGNAIAGFGKDVDAVSEDMFAIQKQIAEDDAREADLAAAQDEAELLYKGENSFYNLRGKAAADASLTLPDKLKQIRAARAKEIKSPLARRLFEDVSSRRYADTLPKIWEHAGKEQLRHSEYVDKGIMENARDQASIYAEDPDLVAPHIDTSMEAATRQARRAGITDEKGIAAARQEAASDVVEGVVSRLERISALVAYERLLEYRDKGTIDPDRAMPLLEALAPKALARKVENDDSDDVYTGGEDVADEPAGPATDDDGVPTIAGLSAAGAKARAEVGTDPAPAAAKPAAAPAVKQTQKPIWDRGTNSRYGVQRGDRTHKGLDINFRQGDDVPVTMDGYVLRHGMDKDGWGRYVEIDHGKDEQGRRITSLYAHLSKNLMPAGGRVKQGDIIALSGGRPRTSGAGNSQGEHLHYELRVDGVPVDPKTFKGLVTAGAGGTDGAPAAPAKPVRTMEAPGRKFDLQATITAIKAKGYPEPEEEARIARAVKKGQQISAAEAQAEEAAQEAMYAFQNTFDDPNNITSFDQVPSNLQAMLKRHPKVQAYWREKIAANAQTKEREAKQEAREARQEEREERQERREIRGELADKARFDLSTIELHQPQLFAREDFDIRKRFPGLDERDIIAFEARQLEMRKSRRAPGTGVPTESIRSAITRMRSTSAHFKGKGKQFDAMEHEVYQDAYRDIEARLRSGQKVEPGMVDAIVSSYMIPAYLPGESKPITRAQLNGRAGSINTRELARAALTIARNGIPPTEADVDEALKGQ